MLLSNSALQVQSGEVAADEIAQQESQELEQLRTELDIAVEDKLLKLTPDEKLAFELADVLIIDYFNTPQPKNPDEKLKPLSVPDMFTDACIHLVLAGEIDAQIITSTYHPKREYIREQIQKLIEIATEISTHA